MENKLRPEYFLATEAATKHDLAGLDLTAFNRIYLGNPFCMEFQGNLLSSVDELGKAIRLANSAGVQSIVSLIAMPTNEQLELVDNLIEVSLAAGANGFEAHSVGVIHMLYKLFSKRPEIHGLTVVAGGFSNVYTTRTAAFYAERGTTLIVPNFELPWETIESVRSDCSIPLEILVHGKIPLGLSESCLLVERSSELGTQCPDSCLSDLWLEFHKWSLRSFGKLTSSGKDLCLFPELPFLWNKGLRDFRIAGLTEKPEHLSLIGRVYREQIDNLHSQSLVSTEIPECLEKLSRYGFCNGYFYGKSGFEWIAQHLQSI